MSLVDELRVVLPVTDPVNGFEQGILTKQEFLNHETGSAINISDLNALYHVHHWMPDTGDCAVYYTKSPTTNPSHPEDQLEAPGRTLIRIVRIMNRIDPTTLQNTLQWGGVLNTTTLRKAAWDIGIRKIFWLTHDPVWPASREVPHTLTVTPDGDINDPGFRFEVVLTQRDVQGRKPPLPPRP